MPKGIHNSRRGPAPRARQEREARHKTATRKAARKWWKKAGSERRARRNAKAKPSGPREDGLTVTTNPDRPLLTFIDAHGGVHTERERSAEQLIAAWEKAQSLALASARKTTKNQP